MKKYKLRQWVKNLIWFLIGSLIGITIYQLFTIYTIETSPVGTYKCSGGIVRICSSSNEVYESIK